MRQARLGTPGPNKGRRWSAEIRLKQKEAALKRHNKPKIERKKLPPKQ